MPIERETIVTGGGGGTVLAIVAAVILVLLAIWLFGGMFTGGETVNVDLPNVSVTR